MSLAHAFDARGRSVAVALLAFVALAALFLALRPTAAAPQERTFYVAITQAMEPGELVVNEGDDVTIRFSADRDVTAHLHGYDLKSEIGAGSTASLRLRADRTGRFPIEDERTDAPIATLVVQPR